MKIYTVSDIHIDYKKNRLWMHNLSKTKYLEDVIILSGDISGKLKLLIEAFEAFKKRFHEVLYVPGNHDVWRQPRSKSNSLENFLLLKKIAIDHGIRIEPVHFGTLSIVPLYGWYDFSFGKPSDQILRTWVDFVACKWPQGFREREVTQYFTSINKEFLTIKNKHIITFSHFLPRIDLMPLSYPVRRRILYPVLGTSQLEKQIRILKPDIHVYGHIHLNITSEIEGINYINNAFGYPHETKYIAKELLEVFEI